jgi:hypothetical protein
MRSAQLESSGWFALTERKVVMATTDQTLKCADCGAQFVFGADEAAWFLEKGFNPPKRCKSCREKRKASRPQPKARQ